ncbi:MAG: type II toxin-antitoxin system VapC family toxin [Candidatus Micrarchaeota archaeon]
MNYFLDTNLFIFAFYEKSAKGERAQNILDEIVRGKARAATSALVLDEVMWAITKNYSSTEIPSVIERVYDVPNVVVIGVDAEAPRLAIEVMKKYGLKPRDAFHAATMLQNEIFTIVSDDADFDRVKEIKRKPI